MHWQRKRPVICTTVNYHENESLFINVAPGNHLYVSATKYGENLDQ